MKIEPVFLTGVYVRLEPLTLEHIDPLCEFGLDERLWKWTIDQIDTRDKMKHYVETALNEQRAGTSLPFITKLAEGGRVIGSTRFGNIDKANRGVEIGWTWIDPKWQRTAINTEAKLLMLRHAFETWDCIRVALKTDALNQQSRNAILRIGASQEGILRRHMITSTGRYRDTVFFSVISDEWEAVRKSLSEKLQRRIN